MRKFIIVILMSFICTQVYGQVRKYYPDVLKVGGLRFTRYTNVSPNTYKAKYVYYADLRGIDRKTASEISKKLRNNLENMGYKVCEITVYNKTHDSGAIGITFIVINREYQFIRDVQKRNRTAENKVKAKKILEAIN